MPRQTAGLNTDTHTKFSELTGGGKVKYLISLIFVISAGATSARKPAQVDSKSKLAAVFQSYIACRPEDKQHLNLVKTCVEPLLPPKTDTYRLDRMALWLVMSPEVSLIRDCKPAELTARRFFPEKTKASLCFEFTIDGAPKTGIAYFKTVAGKSYLYSFDY